MASLGAARRGTPIALDQRPMATHKPAEQLQLEVLTHRRTGVATAIRELENYLAWHRKHPLWGAGREPAAPPLAGVAIPGRQIRDSHPVAPSFPEQIGRATVYSQVCHMPL